MGAAEAEVSAYVAAWQPSSASAAAASFARAVVERAGPHGPQRPKTPLSPPGKPPRYAIDLALGPRPRTVPVLARYHGPLLASAQFAGDGLVTGGTDPSRGNITNPLITSLAGGTGLPRLDTSRLRATWLADCAQILGLATFLHAAGITCSQRLGHITATLPPGDDAAAVSLPGGRAR